MHRALHKLSAVTYGGPLSFLVAMRDGGLLADEELGRMALTAPTRGRLYAQCMTLERASRVYWDAGVSSPIPALIREEAFPSEVCDQLRRSLVVMAPVFAPDSVQAVLEVWLDAPPNADQSRDQIAALAIVRPP